MRVQLPFFRSVLSCCLSLSLSLSAGRRADFLVANDDGRRQERAADGGDSGRGGGHGSRGHGVRHRVPWRRSRRHRKAQAGEVRGLPAHARGERVLL